MIGQGEMDLSKLSNTEIYILTAALEVYAGYKRSDLVTLSKETSEKLVKLFKEEYKKRHLHWEEFSKDD